MTDKELKRLRWMPGEIKRLEGKLQEARARYLHTQGHDVVLGSQTEEPYGVRPVVVRGPGSVTLREAVEKTRRELTDCREELHRLNAFLDGIEDPQTRRIFELHYREGLTWQQVALRMGWSDEGSPRKIAKKYFGDSENSDFGVL